MKIKKFENEQEFNIYLNKCIDKIQKILKLDKDDIVELKNKTNEKKLKMYLYSKYLNKFLIEEHNSPNSSFKLEDCKIFFYYLCYINNEERKILVENFNYTGYINIKELDNFLNKYNFTFVIRNKL